MNKILLPLVFAMFLSAQVFGQVNIDKQIQMSGGTNAEKQITGLGDPGAIDHAVNAGNVQSGTLVYANGTLSGSVYTVTLNPIPAGYTAGMVVNFKPDLESTSPVSINVNGLGAKLIKKNVTTDLGVGDIAADQLVSVIYDGANFQLLSGSSNTFIQNQTSTDQNAGFRISGNGIFNGGSVAIGKPSPTSNLDVVGTVNVAGTSVPTTFSATGGTVTTNGGFTIHTFTSSGTFTPNAAGTVEVLVVAGGGGGSGDLAAGGGAGGVVYNASFPVTAQTYTVTVGAGGYGGGTSRYSNTLATNGQNSSFGSITAVGGGRGGAYWNSNSTYDAGGAGGSGGGAGAKDASVNTGSGAGIPGQGNNGGSAGFTPNFPGGGGGGAGTAGGSFSGVNGGNGGDGVTNSISGFAVTYGGGGGGGGYTNVNGLPGNGGTGGGGKGAGFGALTATAGAPNTGGGGGGGGYNGSVPLAGAAGGSGIIIIRYTTGAAASSGVVVDATGKMGVGTTSPTAQLHTTGSVRFASYTGGFLTVDGNGNLGVSGGSGGSGAGSLFGGSGTPIPFVATGGSVTQVDGYNIHTFTSSGTFTANGAANVEVLVVAGGGGGSGDLAGGGGGGGVVYNAALPVSAQTYTVTVGAGGNGGGDARMSNTLAGPGGNSSFATITAIGGGRGGAYWNGVAGQENGGAGGSGGGAGASDGVGRPGGGGTAGQGNAGGSSGFASTYPGGGGGGAGTAGGNASAPNAGHGGNGLTYSISGSPVTYGGGGGGGGYTGAIGLPGNGGTGGGGKGAGTGSLVAVAGAPNTGGGGGGGGYTTSAPLAGAAGGSGIVIIRYPISTTVTSGIFVGTNGNVGIGTTLPTQALQVVGNICATGTVGTCSDVRYKKDIKPLTSALSEVIKMQGVNYYWRASEFPEKKFGNEKQIGFIAQELEKIYPELVITDSEGYKTVDYSRLTPILVEAIKEQQQQIEQLKLQNTQLKTSLEQKAGIGEVTIISNQLKAQIEELKLLMGKNGLRTDK